jgi:hypothetical protein
MYAYLVSSGEKDISHLREVWSFSCVDECQHFLKDLLVYILDLNTVLYIIQQQQKL